MKAPFYDRRIWFRIALKALVIVLVADVLFIIFRPFDSISSYSVYGHFLPLRKRITVPARDEQSQLGKLETLLHAHEISQPKAADEFRVVVLGDSGINGWGVPDEQTISGYLTALGQNIRSRKGHAYNLAYIGPNVTRDFLIADAALAYQPDLILWFVTEDGFLNKTPDRLLEFNQPRLTQLTAQFQLSDLNARLYGHYQDVWWQRSLLAQRGDIYQWITFQTSALARADFLSVDFGAMQKNPAQQYQLDDGQPTQLQMPSASWLPLTALGQLTNVPVLIVNEPIYSVSEPSSMYDALYDRSLYDKYRGVLASFCADNRLWCLDLWNSLPQMDFSDTPLHHTPMGNQTIASLVAREIIRKLSPK